MADVKITALPAASGLTVDDLFAIVNDPSGVPATQKLTAAQMLAYIQGAIAIAQSQVTNLSSDLALKAPLASPTFTGVPAAPTAAPGTNTTQLASTAFVQAAVTGGTVPDGDKGDITVSGSGTVWTIDSGVVSNAKLRDSAALSIIGRSANSTGVPADIAAGTDGQTLRRSGTTLGFGALDLAAAAAITGVLPAANGGTGVNNSTRTLTIAANAGTLSFSAAASTLTIPATGTAALLSVAQTFTAANRFDTSVGIGAAPVANRRFKIVDAGLIPSNGYVAEIHTDDASPYALGIFNDTYGASTPVFSYFVGNTGKFVMGVDSNESFSLYTNGDAVANYRLVIDATGEATFRNGLRINDNGSSYGYLTAVHADDQNPYALGIFNDTYSTSTPVFAALGMNAGNVLMGSPANKTISLYTNGEANVRLALDDGGATPGNTGIMLWDVDNGTLERVTVGAADSGGVGFKVLRIAN